MWDNLTAKDAKRVTAKDAKVNRKGRKVMRKGRKS